MNDTQDVGMVAGEVAATLKISRQAVWKRGRAGTLPVLGLLGARADLLARGGGAGGAGEGDGPAPRGGDRAGGMSTPVTEEPRTRRVLVLRHAAGRARPCPVAGATLAARAWPVALADDDGVVSCWECTEPTLEDARTGRTS